MKDLTKYNYEELVDRITRMYRDEPGSGNGYQGSTGQMLIEVLADVTDYLHFMLERRSQESFPSTARLESSVWAAASSNGYVPRRNVSARGDLELTLTDKDGIPQPAEFDVNIPYGKIVTFEEENFIVAEDATIPVGESKATIKIIEGVQKFDSFNFSESPYKERGYFTLKDAYSIEEYSISVAAGDGTRFTYVDDQDENGFRAAALSFVDGNYPGYEIKFSRDGLKIVFGDNTFGLRPQGTINVNWIDSKGTDVFIVQTGLGFEFDTETIFDSRSTLPKKAYYYTLKNTTPIANATDYESMDEIRDNMAAFLRSNDRAVTNADYEFRVRKSGLGGIRDVNAYGESENNSLVFSMNNVYIVYANELEQRLSASAKKDLSDYINKYKVNTTNIVYKQARNTDIRIGMTVKRDPILPVSNQQLYKFLLNKVDEYFKIQRGIIGKDFQYSDFLSYLQMQKIRFNGVDYKIAQYIALSVDGFFSFSIPQDAYDGIVELSYNYVPNSNDNFAVTVDGTEYSVNISADDTVDGVVGKMRDELFSNLPYTVEQAKPNQIRITNREPQGRYTISVVTSAALGSSGITQYVKFKKLIQLPIISSGSVARGREQIKEGTIKLKDENNEVIMSDKALNGALESERGFFYPSVPIDYRKSTVELPTLPEGDYYIQFQQNDFQNFAVPFDGYVSYVDFPSWEENKNAVSGIKKFSYIDIMDG